MNVRLLDIPPLSGTIEEVRFQAEGNCAWVLFEPNDADAWVGVFGHGTSGTSRHEAVAALPVPPVSYVVAAGRDYLVDHETRDLRSVYDNSTAQGVIAVPSLKYFVVWDFVKLQAIGADGAPLWLSRRVSWDGIRDVQLKGDSLIGEAWSPIENQWKSFRLEPESGKFTGGSYVSGPWDEQDEQGA